MPRTLNPLGTTTRVLLGLIRALQVLTWIILGIFSIALILFLFGVIPEHFTVALAVKAIPLADPATTPSLESLVGQANVHVGRIDRTLACFYVLGTLLGFGVLQVALRQAAVIVRAIVSGRPFGAEVPPSFVKLALVWLVWPPLAELALWFMTRRLLPQIQVPGLELAWTWSGRDLNWLLIGLFCLALAAAFHAGRTMQDEAELTI